ncbi:MAG: hypothetical protein FJ336_02835, partial [Sphingomonadales bacterium]|nr:hypothetical protein [Sphingomonadales bacterium]
MKISSISSRMKQALVGAVVVVLAAMAFQSVSAQSIQVRAGTVSSCGGDTVSVPISILNANNLGAISLSLNYNNANLTYVGYNGAAPSLGSNLIVNATMMGNTPQVRIAWFNIVPINLNGVMLNMRFVANGNSSMVWDLVTPGNCELADSAANVLPNVSYINGNVTAAVAPSITQQPQASVQVVAGATATFTVTATNAASYQWQRQSGSTWTNLANGSGITGATAASMSIANIAGTLDNTVYRVLVS